MKRSNAARRDPSELSRERALIRRLIELNGWSPPPPEPQLVAQPPALDPPDNIIQFPMPRKGA